jgi:Protein of unknown function (DUF2934)
MTHSCARTPVSRARHDAYQGPAVATPPPSHEEIARLAYAYWETRGRQHGSHQEDWYRAERDLLVRGPSSERA